MSENQNSVSNEKEKKVQGLLSDKEFMEKFIVTSNVGEAQKLFKDNGVDVTEKECMELARFINQLCKSKDELSPEDLDNVVGGRNVIKDVGKGILIGTSTIIGAGAGLVGGIVKGAIKGATGGALLGATGSIVWAYGK